MMAAPPFQHDSSMGSFPRRKTKSLTQVKFPFLLHDVLKDASTKGFENVISWLPCGTAFRVHNQDLFEQYIMPAYFTMSKFSSFQRQLNLYGFLQCREGPRKGCYFNENFNRNCRSACKMVQRSNEKRKSAIAQFKNDGARLPARVPSSPQNLQIEPNNCQGLGNLAGVNPDTVDSLIFPVSSSVGLDASLTMRGLDPLSSNTVNASSTNYAVANTYNRQGSSWYQSHENLLLQYAQRTVGFAPAASSTFSDDDIANEVLQTFNRSNKATTPAITNPDDDTQPNFDFQSLFNDI
jgi:hypothetical protein